MKFIEFIKSLFRKKETLAPALPKERKPRAPRKTAIKAPKKKSK
jgi:hypothetical protein